MLWRIIFLSERSPMNKQVSPIGHWHTRCKIGLLPSNKNMEFVLVHDAVILEKKTSWSVCTLQEYVDWLYTFIALVSILSNAHGVWPMFSEGVTS
jgi:hypothetical protein